MRTPAREAGRRRATTDGAWLLLLTLGVVLTRWPFISDAPLMSKDGPLYVESLRLGRDYCVPMPGNLGYVLLGRLGGVIWPHPTRAFAAANVALTACAAMAVFSLARRWVAPALAGTAALALIANPTVWWHGETINSYLVWLAVLPGLTVFGLRYGDHGRLRDLLGMGATLGIGTMLRQDLLVFGTPLAAGLLLRARARPTAWLVTALLLAASCALWFGAMSAILGGPAEYLTRVQAKHAGHMEGFSPEHRGWSEGLGRNAAKYLLFLGWSAPLIVVPALAWSLGCLRKARRDWRPLALGLLWVGPSLAFSLLVFAGNAGLVFVLLPPLYLAAARFLAGWLGREGRAYPVVAMAMIALASASQFLLAPLLPETDQRNTILNVTFLRYSGPGLRARLDRNLDDYGIDPSLRNVVRQLRAPEPIPGRLADRLGRVPR